MAYFALEPEVAGGLGPASIGDLKARPPRLIKLNYEFDVWLGDPLIEAMGIFVVADALKERLIESRASGVTFGDVEVSKSDQFQDRYPNRTLPSFSWMKITGQAGRDDIGTTKSGTLVVSGRTLKLLEDFGLRHCEVSEYDPNSNL